MSGWICLPSRREGHGAFELFTEGDELYDAMIGAIEGAQRDIGMEWYIFAPDEVGRRFAAALAAKASDDIKVRLHVGAFGSFPAFASIRGELEHAGVELKWFHPFRWLHPFEYVQRNHRKLLVVDGREAFLGGPPLELAQIFRRGAAARYSHPRPRRARARGLSSVRPARMADCDLVKKACRDRRQGSPRPR